VHVNVILQYPASSLESKASGGVTACVLWQCPYCELCPGITVLVIATSCSR